MGVKSASPKTPPGKKLLKSGSPSPKAASPGKRAPKSDFLAQMSPKFKSSSPKGTTSLQQEFLRSRSTSPTAVTPSKASPRSRSSSPAQAKSRSASPKAVTPAKTSPRSKSSSPAQKESKIQRKSGSPGQKAYNTTPIDKRRSSVRESLKDASLTGVTPVKASLNSGVSTPNVQGRFSVSRISTPSPTSEADAVTHQEPATPKIQLKRKSMKRTSRRTSGLSKSAAHVLQRKSGISRASMKGVFNSEDFIDLEILVLYSELFIFPIYFLYLPVINSWADIVKFGQAKAQVVAPTKKMVTQKGKKRVSKVQVG